MPKDIIFECKNNIGLMTLNRVDALNALTFDMILALEHQLHLWHEDEGVHAVVIQAAPGKAFCAGGDVRWLFQGRHTLQQQMQFFWHEYRLNHFIHSYQKPYIALMDGVTMGGGVGISLHGSHRVASERFLFAMPETGIGFFPDIGASYLLSRCPGYWGIYLALTGHRLAVADAAELGLVDYTISAEQFPDILKQLYESDLSGDAHAKVSHILKSLTVLMSSDLATQTQKKIDHTFNGLDIESIQAALMQSEDEWYKHNLDILLQKAPLSLKVTLAQIQKAKHMSMAECINMDYCLVGHFMQDHDFYEGVRALLVDKDKSPKWQPSSLSGVTAAKVSSYFECGQPEKACTGYAKSLI